jgi:hypothetical protein
MKLWGVLLAAGVLAACSAPVTNAVPTPSASGIVTVATPTVSVLAVKSAKPTTKPRPAAKPKPRVSPRPAYTPPVQHYPPPTTTGVVCYVGMPCDLSHLKWTVTYGCTKAWLANQRLLNPKATCPPGQPHIP